MSSSSKKLQREFYGPSLVEVTIGAALSVLLGAILAAGYLIAQPVETVRVMPREPNPDKTYYVTGSARSSLGKGWLRKKQMLLEPGAATIQLSEDELNTWLSSLETKPDGDETSGLIVTKTMNFRIADGFLQVGLPCEVSLPGFNRSVVVQTKGTFVPAGVGFTYAPQEVMVGALAAHRLPLIGAFVANRLASLHEPPEDLVGAWKTLSDINVDGNRLNLVRN